jgi:hypothetical protein
VFLQHAHVLPKHLKDVQTATVRLYSAVSVQLITSVHEYSGDMTRQYDTTTLTTRQDQTCYDVEDIICYF